VAADVAEAEAVELVDELELAPKLCSALLIAWKKLLPPPELLVDG